MPSLAIPTGHFDAAMLQQVAEGRERLVFVSDAFPKLVFKVQKPIEKRVLKRWDLKSFLLKNVAGFEHFIVRQEQRAYVKMCLGFSDNFDRIPVSQMYGFVSSQRGILQISEKISLDGVSLGPTFGQISSKAGFSSEDVVALNRFLVDLRDAQLPTNDINSKNIVKGLDSKGAIRFVLVDGIGDLKLIPIQTISQARRQAHLVRMFSKIGGRGLMFDREAFAFRLLS